MGCYKKDVIELLDHFCNVVAENVADGRAVSYKGLGIFYPQKIQRKNKNYGAIRIKYRPAKKMINKIRGD